jgi:hypothetical protein
MLNQEPPTAGLTEVRVPKVEEDVASVVEFGSQVVQAASVEDEKGSRI